MPTQTLTALLSPAVVDSLMLTLLAVGGALLTAWCADGDPSGFGSALTVTLAPSRGSTLTLAA